MKQVVVTMAFVCTALFAHAQFNSNFAAVSTTMATAPAVSPVVRKPAAPASYGTQPLPGLRQRNAGRIMTIAGGALLVGGLIVYESRDSDTYEYYSGANGTYEEGDPKAAIGPVMMVAGAGLAIPGVILWSKGAKKYKRNLERQASINIGRNGVGLAYSF